MVCNKTAGQTEVMAWGNITGIRIDGQLMEFETSVKAVSKGWVREDATGKERRKTSFDRQGSLQIVNSAIGGVKFTETVKENGRGSAVVAINCLGARDTTIEGIFYCIDLPNRYFGEASAVFSRSQGSKTSVKLSQVKAQSSGKPVMFKTTGFIVEAPERRFEIIFDEDINVYVKKAPSSSQLYVTLTGSRIRKSLETYCAFTIKTDGKIDHSPALITIQPDKPGARFAGFGGNFRLQNENKDPQVIQYCLDSMRVAWGRVEMPWQLWHPDENTDPVQAALSGKLNEHVRQSMEMAKKLAQRGMPVIISDWSAPAWAIIGDPADAYRYRSKGIYGYQLNPAKMQNIYKSIADYLVYLKDHYGVEPALFSFNESDLGIDVRHTGKEHADFIKGIGAYFASRGIVTKLLLGDNSDATTFDFILPAMNDSETHKYIGAISFHSWRGCDDETLKKWAGAARQMNLPLIVAEGSTDAAAWNYPEIFYEQSFALYEINLYMRLCSFCQPLSILQWQLTSDYSVLAGKGIFGTEGELRPSRRFWNLKQLASTPEDAFSIPFNCNNDQVNCAVFGNIARNAWAIHMVNNGASRTVKITGIPADIKALQMYVTDDKKGMEITTELKVVNGTVEAELPPAAFISLFSVLT
jgi:hypothetical protein